MKLHELRQELETDATRRAEQQEKTIRELHTQIKGLEHQVEVHQNRCFVLSMGQLCPMCLEKETCKMLKAAKTRAATS